MKTYGVGIGEVEKILADIKSYQQNQEQKIKTFLERMAELGAEKATVNFKNALYAGENDVNVSYESRGSGTVVVVATGFATLFIEFGTGITYPDDHPEKPSGVAERGKYGKGHGSRKIWGYYGEPGNLGTRSKDRPDLILTSGSPANLCMYKAKQSLLDSVREVAEEVLSDGRH